jgi:hypothetical protein
VDAAEATELLAETTGRPFTILGPLTGGETGATAIQDADGQRFVLKWTDDPTDQRLRRRGVELAERLRADAGWPAPQQRTFDAGAVLLVLQDLMPGAAVEHLSHGLVDELLALHERRLGVATSPADAAAADEAAAELIITLVVGGDGYCLHEPLRTHDVRTRRIVERIEAVGRALDPSELGGTDVVHGDLHPGNLLQVSGRLSAVVDLDYARVGDARFDLAMLALSSLGVEADPGVRRRLLELGIDELPDALRAAYVGNFLLRCLDWGVRKDRAAEVEFWIAHADRLLPDS